MARYWKQVAVCTALWTLVSTMAIGATARGDQRLMLWAILVASPTCMVTGWLVAVCAATIAVERGRVQLEDLARIMAECAAREQAMDRIH